MSIQARPKGDFHRAASHVHLRHDALAGLRRPRKQLPCKYFYDERGSQLFDEICLLEEYYPTRCELAIMRLHADEMAAACGERCLLIEYGSGSSTKTRRLLSELVKPAGYVPVDISREHLHRSAARIALQYANLPVLPRCADFTAPLELPPDIPPHRRRVVYFPGSTIGNFSPRRARMLLQWILELCGEDGGLLIGVDLKKPQGILERAYNDAAGVTAAFNLNLLARLNRELGADFDPRRFKHFACYNREHGRIEMHLISQCEQVVHVSGERVHFRRGEGIRTECSYKYDLEDFSELAASAGWDIERCWVDPNVMFSVQYLVPARQPTRSRKTPR